MYLVSSAVPDAPIVSAADLMQHLRLVDTSEASYLEALSLAAESMVEKQTSVGLQPLAREYLIIPGEVSAGGDLLIPYGPVVMPSEDEGSVVNPISLVAVDADGTETELPVSDGALMRSCLAASDCTGGAIYWMLRCTAGPSVPPALARPAIQLIVGAWYERREAVDSLTFNEVPFGARALINLLADPASRL